MKIVADSHIPYLDVCSSTGVQLVRCDHITRDELLDADALLVRTRTRCDAALLAGTTVKFIGSATIGTDHIDIDYCRSHGIKVCNAPGCNAPAVAQWVLASIGSWMQMRGIDDFSVITVGIVGVGHVGSIVARWARQLGFSVLLNDPPRSVAEGAGEFVPIDVIRRECDIITFHTPLTRGGEWPTWHLCDSYFLQQAQRCRLLMNASRGAVVDTNALLGWHGDLAIDCWEGEPDINCSLLEHAYIATPHIAGYSIEGKMRGTAMVLSALARHFHLSLPSIAVEAPLHGTLHPAMKDIMTSYNPLVDTAALKADPASFEALRNRYALRHEVADSHE